jgi:hypothetical protein
MKQILFIFLLSFSFLGFSQDIDFKKGIIYLDGKECMKYDSDSNTVTYQNLNGDDIMILKYMRPDGSQSSLYTKVIFIESHREFTSQNFIFTKKSLIEKLIKSNVLVGCVLNDEKLENFILKYDEKVEDRLRGNSTNTIIIKEEPRRSGVNINIGR